VIIEKGVRLLKLNIPAALLCTAFLVSCSTDITEPAETAAETTAQTEAPENMVRSNPAAYALGSELDGGISEEPFSSYTYDFSVLGNNYMITVTPDEIGTGLTLTVEDNNFEFTKFGVTPPENYMVCLPYSQQYASQVCTVIKSESEDSDIPDLLKIDFYLMNFEYDLPYTVSRLYSVMNGNLVEIEVYNTEEDIVETAETGVAMKKSAEPAVLEHMDHIPESVLYRTEELTFMPEPVVTVNEDGSLEAEIITYRLNPYDLTLRRSKEVCTVDNTLYYGYAAHAIAGDIYRYFIATSLNVSDYENYVEMPSADGKDDKYFFKVDDPRFSTKEELREYVSRYFDEKLVNRMFLEAPQQYCDIDGELYTILGDGGINEELGKLTITGWDIDGNTITYHTKQEKYNSDHMLDGYIDGGDFVIETDENGGFIVKEYRYPTDG